VALTIDATVGGASSNSFVTLAESETYMEGRLNVSLWTAATDANKNIALVEATRDLDVKEYPGNRVSATQSLSWPRDWAIDPDDPNLDYFDTTEVPTRIKNATCELAMQYIKAGTTDLAALDSATNIKRKKVDVLETEYFASTSTPQGLGRYPRVIAYIRPLLAASGVTTETVHG